MSPSRKHVLVAVVSSVVLLAWIAVSFLSTRGAQSPSASADGPAIVHTEQALSAPSSEERAPLALPTAERREPLDAVASTSSGAIRLRGRVTDSHGGTVSGARVACSSPFDCTTSDDRGEFSFEVHAQSGALVLVASHSTHGHRRVETIVDGSAEHFVDIQLLPGAAVRVLVVDQELRPFVGAEVRLWRQTAGSTEGALIAARDVRDRIGMRQLLEDRPTAHVGETDASGRLTLGGLPEGEYGLVVDGPGSIAYRRPGIVVPALSVVDLGTVQLESGTSLSQSVRDCAGVAVPGASIRALFEFEYLEAVSDANGDFVLRGIPIGVLEGEIAVESPGGGTYWNPEFSLFDSGAIALCRGTLRLELSGPAGPLAGSARLTLDCGRWGALLGSEYGEDRTVDVEGGLCTLRYVPECARRIELDLPGFHPVALSLDDLDATRAIPVRLEEAAR